MADDVMAWLDDGPLLERMGADPTVTALVASLHTEAWLELPGDDRRIYTRTGGRQGCKLGAMVFNLAYSLALWLLGARLREAGVVLHVKHPRNAHF